MTRPVPVSDTVTLHVPFRIVKRGGRKEVRLPEDGAQPRRTDSTLVKALARAFRWKRMLASGEFATISELAESEGIALSYMTRVLRLTLLAPDIVEAILDGRQPDGVTLPVFMRGIPVEWDVQPQRVGTGQAAGYCEAGSPRTRKRNSAHSARRARGVSRQEKIA